MKFISLTKLQKHPLYCKRGFTLIEMLVAITIFAFMTAYLLAKYQNFDQGVFVNNLAYDVALTVRQSQNYGLDVKNSGTTASPDFQKAYGVSFDVSNSGNNQQFIFFSEPLNGNGTYDSGSDIAISTYSLKQNMKIKALCINDAVCASTNISNSKLDIIFRRPNPTAIINNSVSSNSSAKIVLVAADGITTKSVVVRSTGEISVEN